MSCCWTSGNLLYTLESSLFSFWEHRKVLQCMVSKFSQTSTGEIKGLFVHIIKPPCSLVQLADSSPERFRTKTAWVFLGQVESRLAELCQATSSTSSWTQGSNPRCSRQFESHKKQAYDYPLFKSVCLKAVTCTMSFALLLLSLLSSILIDIVWLC